MVITLVFGHRIMKNCGKFLFLSLDLGKLFMCLWTQQKPLQHWRVELLSWESWILELIAWNSRILSDKYSATKQKFVSATTNCIRRKFVEIFFKACSGQTVISRSYRDICSWRSLYLLTNNLYRISSSRIIYFHKMNLFHEIYCGYELMSRS